MVEASKVELTDCSIKWPEIDPGDTAGINVVITNQNQLSVDVEVAIFVGGERVDTDTIFVAGNTVDNSGNAWLDTSDEFTDYQPGDTLEIGVEIVGVSEAFSTATSTAFR